jgi:hypothetical protein
VWDGADTEWDVSAWSQTDTTLGDFVDVTCDVLDDGVGLKAGASSADGVVTRWEAATCDFRLVGTAYDPRSGPWAGLLGPGVEVAVRWRTLAADAEWLTAFRGLTDDEGFSYDPKAKVASVAATDGIRVFAAYDGPEQPPIGQGETAAERVARIADMVRWPTDRRDIEPGGVPLKQTTLAEAAWTMLLQVADTDLAHLWINRAGELAYRPQGKVLPQQIVHAWIGCHVDDPPEGATVVTPIQLLGQQPTITRNVVSISRQARDETDEAATVTLVDDSSVARYFPHTYERTDLIHTEDAWSTRVAEAILAASAWPSAAPESVELDSNADPAATALLLGLEPSLTVVVDDGESQWICEPAGWEVAVRRNGIHGTIQLLDVSSYYGATWDNAAWDETRWGW